MIGNPSDMMKPGTVPYQSMLCAKVYRMNEIGVVVIAKVKPATTRE